MSHTLNRNPLTTVTGCHRIRVPNHRCLGDAGVLASTAIARSEIRQAVGLKQRTSGPLTGDEFRARRLEERGLPRPGRAASCTATAAPRD